METKQVVKTVGSYDENGYWVRQQVVTEKRIFNDEDRMAVVAEYQAGKMTAAQIVEKYHLSSRQVLFIPVRVPVHAGEGCQICQL